MLHELLLALKGHASGLFHESPRGIQVIPNIPFNQTSEEAILNELCKIGTHNKHFVQFIQHYGGGLLRKHNPNDGDELHGLYLKQFCQGLDSVLQDYQNVLLNLEQDILYDPFLPLSQITHKLQMFHLLFPVLDSTIEQIVTHKAHGCYILDILHKNSLSSTPVVKDALNRIKHICHLQLFQQLSAWMLYGTISDPYHEFFIQASKKSSSAAAASNQEGDGTKSLQRQDVTMDTGQFQVVADLLPSYISPRIAYKILFVGESVQMCERDKDKIQSFRQVDTIMNKKEIEFAMDLQGLARQPEFNSIGFETVIDKIRAHAAEYLWILVVEESGLCNELKIMKDFLLLGRGELFLTFIDQAQHLLRTPATSTTEHDVNRAFQQAARNVLIDNDSLIQRFNFTVPTHSKKGAPVSSKGDVETGWNVLGLTYSVQWPLHLFFTPSILEKYGRVFKFLLAVRRTQLDLQHCWSLQMFSKKSFISPAASSTWQLRTHMAFLVDNLQYYLQVDVIESQYKILLDKINSTKDFEIAKLAHEHFLSSLLTQCFVHMKTVSSCLYEILDQCSTFCRILVSAESEMTEQECSRLQTITQNFQRLSSLLFGGLSSVKSQSASPHLAQLLLRLDFNKFYTTMGGQLGSC